MSVAVKLDVFTPPEPTPLVPERGERTSYPVEALGPVLAGAVAFIVEATRCAPETAAQSVLAAAALAAQAHADVLTPAGQVRPLSLFLGTDRAVRRAQKRGRRLRPRPLAGGGGW